MKKAILLFFAIMMAIPSLWAFEVDGVFYYIINEADRQAGVGGCSQSSNSITIRSSVTYDDVIYSVSSISGGAFHGCTNLTSISIPNSITSIGDGAFYGCSGLTSISIPNGITKIGPDTFSKCTSLTSISIPNSVTSIGYDAFYGCTSLTNVTIPNSVTEIGGYAFSNCTALTSISIPNSVSAIYECAFAFCSNLTDVTIDDSDTELNIYDNTFAESPIKTLSYGRNLNSNPFQGMVSLTNLTIGNKVTIIRDAMFCNCSNLVSANISNGVTVMGSSAFTNCSSLKSITIPNRITKINNYTFEGCSSLESVTIPNSVTEIGGDAFYGCTSLTNVTIPNSVTEIGGYAFSNCTALTSISIPNSVSAIYGCAFAFCSNLTDVTIDDSDTELNIYDSTFAESPIEELYLGRNLSYEAFQRKTSLIYLTIGCSVTEIGEYAFSNCTNIQKIDCYPTTPPIASSTTFPKIVYENAILNVPIKSELAYKATIPWKYFWNSTAIENILVNDVTLTIQNGAIVVTGIDASIYIDVYNLHGQRVYYGNETTIPVNEQGIYLVKIGNRVVKVVM